MDKLRFGTAGIPISSPRGTVNGIHFVRELGLDCMELEFVRSVNITEDKTNEFKQVAKKNDVALTCHAPYYVNLNSPERMKIEASKKRIYNSARIAALCGASSVTFHAAFYMKTDPEKTYQMVKKGVEEVLSWLKRDELKIWIRPETTGKGSQWGDEDEIIRLSSEVRGVLPCFDFSHLFARSVGKLNTKKDYLEILGKVEKVLGREGLNEMHIHMSGIEYGPKGERWHLTMAESEFKWQEVLRALKEFKCKGNVISESPNIEKDALMMQEYWQKI